MKPRRIDDVDHSRGMFIAKNADGDHLGRQPLHDVLHRLHTHLPRGCGEHETEGIGPHRGCQQRVCFRGDAANLDEHDLKLILQTDPSVDYETSNVWSVSAGDEDRTSVSPTSTA